MQSSSPTFVDAQTHLSTPARTGQPPSQQMHHYQPRTQQFATPARMGFPTHLASETPGSSKSVRFQSQPLPQNQQYVAAYQQQQNMGQQSQSPVSLMQQRTHVVPPQNTVSTSQRSAASSQPSVAASKPVELAKREGASVSVSSTSLSRRLQWNASALAVLWVTPLLTTRPMDAYWAGLDLVYEHLGGNMDERVDALVGWTLWATTIVLLFNALEALVLLNRASTAAPSATTTAKSPAVLGFQSPGVAKSINFVAASRLKGSSKTRASSIGPGSPIAASHSPSSLSKPRQPANSMASGSKDAVDYSRFSPSLRRSSPSSVVAGSGARSVSASGSAGRTHASPMPTSVSMGSLGMGASPLSAFRARHSSSSSPFRRSSSQMPSSADADVSLSYEFDDDSIDGSNFVGDESLEVERALHSLRSSMPPPSPTPSTHLTHPSTPNTPNTAIRA